MTTRLHPEPSRSSAEAAPAAQPIERAGVRSRRRAWALGGIAFVLCLLVALFVGLRLWFRHAAEAALPQTDGRLVLAGLSRPVVVLRDESGVPSIRAASLDDLVFAQAFVTAQDRLFQLDLLRRHAAGELAEILGRGLIEHDVTQRVLQMRAAADRATAALPANQRHSLEVYAAGVNAAMSVQSLHPSLEFRLLGYRPRPWLPRDSVLLGLIMYQDLTTEFPEKLDREAFTRQLDPSLSPEIRTQLLADLYPVGSWRDHPPTQPAVDLSRPVDSIPDIPLDDSQARSGPSGAEASEVAELIRLTERLAPSCMNCRAGSNNWVVAGANTRSGNPLLSNDMHLSLSVPEIWYQVDLQAPLATGGEPFHVAGVSLPGTPFVVVGHNAHVAWGFTSLGADVQDLYIEHLRGSGKSAQYEALDRSWRPLLHQRETIRVRGASPVVLDVLATQHGGIATPVLSPMLPSEKRPLALRWTIYDPQSVTLPFFAADRAATGAELVRAFASLGGPGLNLVYADDAGHIGYHALGHIPVRGSTMAPTSLSPVPIDVLAPDAAAHEWVGHIPFDRLPQVTDPPNGLLATANARVTPEDYPFPFALNWPDPYRNERIWKLLSGRKGLTSADMLAVQTDIYSDPDRLIARHLAYALDHAAGSTRRRRQAADLLRAWDGRVNTESAAAAITDATRTALWPLLLTPKLQALAPVPGRRGPTSGAHAGWQLYHWGARAFAEEQIITHQPARWLPASYGNWNDLLAAAVDRGLQESHAPDDLAEWQYGVAHPVELTHPLFAQSWLLRLVSGLHAGTGKQPQSGDGTTIKQVGRAFGPSERFTAVIGNWDASTLNLAVGQSGDPVSPWFLDQFRGWLAGRTRPMPFSSGAIKHSARHTLILEPRL